MRWPESEQTLGKIVKDRKTWCAIVHGVAKGQTWFSNSTTTIRTYPSQKPFYELQKWPLKVGYKVILIVARTPKACQGLIFTNLVKRKKEKLHQDTLDSGFLTKALDFREYEKHLHLKRNKYC